MLHFGRRQSAFRTVYKAAARSDCKHLTVIAKWYIFRLEIDEAKQPDGKDDADRQKAPANAPKDSRRTAQHELDVRRDPLDTVQPAEGNDFQYDQR